MIPGIGDFAGNCGHAASLFCAVGVFAVRRDPLSQLPAGSDSKVGLFSFCSGKGGCTEAKNCHQKGRGQGCSSWEVMFFEQLKARCGLITLSGLLLPTIYD